jgi:hypothetical protein
MILMGDPHVTWGAAPFAFKGAGFDFSFARPGFLLELPADQ